MRSCFCKSVPLFAQRVQDTSRDPCRAEAKDAFISDLVTKMTIPEMVLQLHLMFASNVIGPASDNSLYDIAMRFAPGAALGMIHDWYPLDKTYHNELQRLNLEKARLRVPFIHYGECLHGVASFNQSMFPQPIGLAASFDTDLVRRVGRAIGTEARAIGIHACLAPVLDICKDPRWGRCQEGWGEDKILTSHMGVAFASGLSKNGSWANADAVVPVMKHFAAHGSAQSGGNGAPFMGHGNREVLEEHLVPFKAAFDLGGVRGVMMAYHELDDVPSHVNPLLYRQLEEWGFDGFVTADDTGMAQLQMGHQVAKYPADAIQQWFNAGGMVQYYDYPLKTLLNATMGLVANGSVQEDLLRAKVKRILGVKYDLGLFDEPYILGKIDPYQLTTDHVPLTLEAAQKTVVLLENKNKTLPFDLERQGLKKVALIGPFGDILNYGDYAGQYGAYPVANSSTIREGILNHLSGTDTSLVTSMGANTWLYNAHYPIPPYHLLSSGMSGGLLATYYADTNFSQPRVQRIETPTMTWGLYPPPGLPSNNFSVIWQGELNVPVDGDVDGWLGVALGPNTTARLYVDGALHIEVPFTKEGNILSNIPGRSYSLDNATLPPPGSNAFTFQPGKVHKIRLEYQTWNLYQKIENVGSLNAQVLLFWNLVDRNAAVGKSVEIAKQADVIMLAVGGAWNSDGESGDRGTFGLSANQTALADAIFALGKPVVMILQGGRPFAIPTYYARAAAVVDAYFSGQAGGQAIADVLFGTVNPGGRVPISIPKFAGQLPIYYNYKQTARKRYVDIDALPQYPFGHGLSYTTFKISNYRGSTMRGSQNFTVNDTIVFEADISNTGLVAGSYVAQIYLLQRISQITQPLKQLVAFQRLYIGVGETVTARMELEVERYLRILNRRYHWEVEKGMYVFAMLDNGGWDALWNGNSGGNITLQCI
ncbi:glycoside hydrolase family 3 protein [Lindgomyces ingoldianus]|uniref:Glycoside hydrolase family 3 protein n=1 Tax=Lindgomyces ingoldianus TaxID=673940 RepID=A0ACB6QJG8_9PLEO|nr:glycoside hydrolase family 3 protein [Lindgomyces ingoldianus]KAF2467159.1 glycoside hydrolase family 3 protein [Lindgomyces ingoldianus]